MICNIGDQIDKKLKIKNSIEKINKDMRLKNYLPSFS